MIELSVEIAEMKGVGGGRSRAGTVQWLERQLKRVLGMMHITDAQWTISVVGDEQMKTLHLRTMGLASTTDVLTFDMREQARGLTRDVEGERVELDTVMCWDEAQRRAAELKHDVGHELLLYAVHSLLHVQGYDDRTHTKARQMHRREDELLSEMGIGKVFAKTITQTERRPSRAMRNSGSRGTRTIGTKGAGRGGGGR